MGVSVVVIEDDDDVAELVVASLRRADLTVVRAPDGRAGVDLVRREQPRLVLLDWMMPEKDGIATCRQIRSDSSLPQPQIVMLTVRSSVNDVVRARDAGADDLIPKPFRPRHLVSEVAERLAG